VYEPLEGSTKFKIQVDTIVLTLAVRKQSNARIRYRTVVWVFRISDPRNTTKGGIQGGASQSKTEFEDSRGATTAVVICD